MLHDIALYKFNIHIHIHITVNERDPISIARTRLSTVGDRALPVAAARVWNSLPQHVTSAPSAAAFRSRPTFLRLLSRLLISTAPA